VIEVVITAIEGTLLGLAATHAMAARSLDGSSLEGIEAVNDLDSVLQPEDLVGAEPGRCAYEAQPLQRSTSCLNLGGAPQAHLEPMVKLPVQGAEGYRAVVESPEHWELAGTVTLKGVSAETAISKGLGGEARWLTWSEKFEQAGFAETNVARDIRAAGPIKEVIRRFKSELAQGQFHCRAFKNHDGMLPAKGLDLFEADVPNAGNTRGSLRVVLGVPAGSKGPLQDVWWTHDHYKTFQHMRL